MRCRFCLPVFFFLATVGLYGQAGMSIYLGPSAAFSGDKFITPGGQGHYGYVIGAHARLNSDFMYFILTGEYGAFDLISSEKLNFIGGDDLTYIKGKIGLGFDVKRFNKKTVLRSKLQGSVMFVNDFDVNLLNDPTLVANGYTKLNDGIAGLSTCIGITRGIFDFDLEYEYGFFNLYNTKKESKLNFLSLTAGVRF
ncbi:MAG: hypothetical protein IPN29_18100 [Saprospiraceae bacterium]|nr:hypothetical protein [Saprospiraceae bacterium]